MGGLYAAFLGVYEKSRLKKLSDAFGARWAAASRESRVIKRLYDVGLPKRSFTYNALARSYRAIKRAARGMFRLGAAFGESRLVAAASRPGVFLAALFASALSLVSPPYVSFGVYFLLCVYSLLGGVNALALAVFICPFFPPLAFLCIVSAACAGHFLRLLAAKNYGRAPTPLDALVLIFAAAVIFSSVSVFSISALLGGALPFLSLAFFYIAITGAITKKDDWVKVAFSFISSATAVSALNIISLFSSVAPNFQQTILAIILSVALGAAASGWKKAGAYALGATMLASLVLTWPGGALTTAAAAFLLFVFIKNSRFFIPAVLVALLIAALLPIDAPRLWMNITSETSKNSLSMWEGMREVLLHFKNAGLQNIVGENNRAIFSILTWSGVIGFLGFALLTALFFVEASRSLGENKNAFLIGVIAAAGGGVSGILSYGFDGGSLAEYNLLGGFWIFTAIMASWAYITRKGAENADR